MENKDEMIELLGKLSKTPQHELIVDLLDYYGTVGTSELTEEQVREFYERITV